MILEREAVDEKVRWQVVESLREEGLSEDEIERSMVK